MDHNIVVRQHLTERYLLGELTPEARDEFEEHFFDCTECALDVHAGALFVDTSKTIPADLQKVFTSEHGRGSEKPGWLARLREVWLRPVIVMPALAILLAVIGYQNLMVFPKLQQAQNSPQLLSTAQLNIGIYGSEAQIITKRADEDFSLFVRVTPDGDYSHFIAELFNPDGKREWSLMIPEAAAKDPLLVRIPGAKLKAGTYNLVVHGITTNDKSTDVGQASFELHIQSESK
jgi:putative zinc finger protein